MSEEDVRKEIQRLNDLYIKESDKKIVYSKEVMDSLIFGKTIKLEQENKQLQNNWNELKKCIKETKEEIEKSIGHLTTFDKGTLVAIRVIYKKIQELEEWKEC